MKVSGVWRYVYRATDHNGQVIDVFVSTRRDTVAARRFFTAAIRDHGQPCEVVTARVAALAKAIGELAPDASHTTVQYEQSCRSRPRPIESALDRWMSPTVGSTCSTKVSMLPRRLSLGSGRRSQDARSIVGQTSPRSSGFLDAERRQPSPQRKLHDLETVVQWAVSEIGSP